MKAITEGGSGKAAFRAVQKHCGRCGVVMKKNEFCRECRKFFHVLSGSRAISISS